MINKAYTTEAAQDLTTEQANALMALLAPLVAIADAYDKNNLDDGARKFYGPDSDIPHDNDPAHIELYSGRGGRELLNLQACLNARHVARSKDSSDVIGILLSLQPLIEIADAYDANELDDEARKTWGRYSEYENETPHGDIELYCSRGGGRLLTLEHAMNARKLVAETIK